MGVTDERDELPGTIYDPHASSATTTGIRKLREDAPPGASSILLRRHHSAELVSGHPAPEHCRETVRFRLSRRSGNAQSRATIPIAIETLRRDICNCYSSPTPGEARAQFKSGRWFTNSKTPGSEGLRTPPIARQMRNRLHTPLP
jgi:hypothetical protein